MEKLKRYGIFLGDKTNYDSDNYWETVMLLYKDDITNIYIVDRQLGGVNVGVLDDEGIRGRLAPTFLNLPITIILSDLSIKYNDSIIPIPSNIEPFTARRDDNRNITQIELINGVDGIISKKIGYVIQYYSNDIDIVVRQFYYLKEIFASEDTTFISGIKKLANDVVSKYNEIETRNLTDGKTTISGGSSSGNNTTDKHIKSADTPEYIPNYSISNTIEKYISALEQQMTENNTTGEFSSNENVTGSKTGTITREKTPYLNLLDILNKLKFRYEILLEKIINDIAISYSFGG